MTHSETTPHARLITRPIPYGWNPAVVRDRVDSEADNREWFAVDRRRSPLVEEGSCRPSSCNLQEEWGGGLRKEDTDVKNFEGLFPVKKLISGGTAMLRVLVTTCRPT